MQKAQVSGRGVVQKNEAIAFAFAFAAGDAEVGAGVLHGCRAGGGAAGWYE